MIGDCKGLMIELGFGSRLILPLDSNTKIDALIPYYIWEIEIELGWEECIVIDIHKL